MARKYSTIPIRAVIFAYLHGFISEDTINHLTENPEEIIYSGNDILFKDNSRHVAIQHLGDFDFMPISAVIPDGIGG
jgi:hypothetical protein